MGIGILVSYVYTVTDKSQFSACIERMLCLFRASEGILAQKMLTTAATILLLQQMMILPRERICQTCDMLNPGEYQTDDNDK